MTQNEAILAILAEAGIEADQKMGESTAFDVLESHIEGALDEIDRNCDDPDYDSYVEEFDDDDDDDD